METFREHTTQKALSRISDRHSNNVGRNFGFDHNYVSIGVGGKGTNESCTIMSTYTVFYFLEWFWNFCSANIFHCISFSFYYFKIKAIKSPRCWNLRLSDRDLGYRAGNFQTMKHFICSMHDWGRLLTVRWYLSPPLQINMFFILFTAANTFTQVNNIDPGKRTQNNKN